MALINCPECENKISDKAKNCPHCGFPVSKRIVEWDVEKESYIEEELVNRKFHKTHKAPKRNVLTGFFIAIVIMIIAINTCDDKDYISNSKTQVANSEQDIKVKYAQAALNVREKPIQDSKVLKTLQPNEKVKTKGVEVDGFVQILNSENKLFGWASSSYLVNEPLPESNMTTLKQLKILRFNICSKQDITFGDIPRMVYRITLETDSIPSESTMKNTAVNLWENGNRKWEEFIVFMYLPGQPTNGLAFGIGKFNKNGLKSFEKTEYTNGFQISQKENNEKETTHYSSSYNRYIVKIDHAFAATTEKNFDLMMNCVLSDDKQALQTMIANGQVILLNKYEVVFLVDPTFKYYKVRREGSTELLYTLREFLKKQ